MGGFDFSSFDGRVFRRTHERFSLSNFSLDRTLVNRSAISADSLSDPQSSTFYGVFHLLRVAVQRSAGKPTWLALDLGISRPVHRGGLFRIGRGASSVRGVTHRLTVGFFAGLSGRFCLVASAVYLVSPRGSASFKGSDSGSNRLGGLSECSVWWD